MSETQAPPQSGTGFRKAIMISVTLIGIYLFPFGLVYMDEVVFDTDLSREYLSPVAIDIFKTTYGPLIDLVNSR